MYRKASLRLSKEGVGPSIVKRKYASLINPNTSVDTAYGVAPPPAPVPQEVVAKNNNSKEVKKESPAKDSKSNRLSSSSSPHPSFFTSSQINTSTKLTDLLKGKNLSSDQRRNAKEAISAAIGATRRGTGTAIPTQDLEDSVIPVETRVPVNREEPHAVDSIYGRNDLDERILIAARALHHSRSHESDLAKNAATLQQLQESFKSNSERVLSITLPNESTPSQERRVILGKSVENDESPQDDGVLLIAYVAGINSGRGQERITVCSGFAIEGGDKLSENDGGNGKGALIVSSAHTLQASLPNRQDTSSIALAITRKGHIFPINQLLSSLPSSDLILLQLGEHAIDSSVASASTSIRVKTLPVSAYPAPVSTELIVSSFEGWEDDKGAALPSFQFDDTKLISKANNSNSHHTRNRWRKARVVQYSDRSGQEAMTGTYDDLCQMDFKLLLDTEQLRKNPPASFPPAGSSGGPIIDAITGAVVGIVRGTKMSVLEGKRGDAIPAERLFFMFTLPGFKNGKK